MANRLIETGYLSGGTGPQPGNIPVFLDDTGRRIGDSGKTPSELLGVQGITGIQGITGAGGIGETGPQGDTGVLGATGLQGHTGIQGVDGLGGLTDAYGEMYQFGNAATTTISASDTWVKVWNFNKGRLWQVGYANSQLVIPLDGVYFLVASVTVQPLSSPATFQFALAINGWPQMDILCQRTWDDTNIHVVSVSGLLSLQPDDRIELYVKNLYGTENCLIKNSNVSLFHVNEAIYCALVNGDYDFLINGNGDILIPPGCTPSSSSSSSSSSASS